MWAMRPKVRRSFLLLYYALGAINKPQKSQQMIYATILSELMLNDLASASMEDVNGLISLLPKAFIVKSRFLTNQGKIKLEFIRSIVKSGGPKSIREGLRFFFIIRSYPLEVWCLCHVYKPDYYDQTIKGVVQGQLDQIKTPLN
jgi:hypothetical protein